jgi:cystathionine gamma-lyase|eukprot:gene9971-10835_t
MFANLIVVVALVCFCCAVNGGFLGDKKFATRVVHAGCEAEHNANSVVPQISLSTTFVQSYPGKKPGLDDPNSHGGGYFYSRQANPTRGALERALASVEEAQYSSVFASGLAATQAVLQILNSGDHVIALDDLYGGTSGMFRNIITPGNGISFSFVNMDKIETVEAAITPKTKMIWLESPTNPLLKTTDIRAIAALAKKKGLLLVVDGTFLSPYLQKPLALGADIVVHSLTKYIAGHSDVLMGAVVTNNEDVIKKLRNIQNFCGAVPSPFECYLTLRGLKTLHVRVDYAQKNAQQIAQFLESHPVVERVIYPGLKSYPQYELAQKQSSGPGAMITIHVKGGLKVAGRFLEELKIFALAVSLGAVESLASSPALMTHTAVPQAAREAIGLTDSLIRLSIGIEDSEDLIADLKQALDKAYQTYQQNGSK